MRQKSVDKILLIYSFLASAQRMYYIRVSFIRTVTEEERTVKQGMNTENNDSNNQQIEPHLAMAEDEFKEIKQLAAEHGPRILVGICIGLLIVGGFSFYKTNKANKLQQASSLLTNAKSANDLQAVLTQYPNTPSAQLALLSLAKVYYNSGNYDMAMTRYSEFMSTYPNHPLSLICQMGTISCIEAKGMTEKALWDYTAFINEHSDSFLCSQAILSKARCLNLLGKKEEAKEVYEEFIAANPESEWNSIVEDLLAEVKKELSRKNNAIDGAGATE